MDCCKEPTAMYGVVCPKPRRVVPSNLNSVSLSPASRFHLRNDAESDLLGLILRQGQNKAERNASLSTPPPFSPPDRAQNPIIQDADFGAETPTFMHLEYSTLPFDGDRVTVTWPPQPSSHSR